MRLPVIQNVAVAIRAMCAYCVFALLIFTAIPAFGGEVRLEGFIDGDSVILVAWQLKPGDTLMLNSKGGYLHPAAVLADNIRKYGINTHVRSTAECQSACVLIFASGVKRTVGKNVMFFLHRPLGDGEDVAARQLIKQLIQYGVSPEIRNIFPATHAAGMVGLNYEDLKRLNFITE